MKEKIDQKFQVFSQPGMRQEHMEKREFLTPLLLDGFGGELPEEEHRILMKEAISCGLLDGEEPEALNYAVMVTRILDKDGKNCTTRGSVKAIVPSSKSTPVLQRLFTGTRSIFASGNAAWL